MGWAWPRGKSIRGQDLDPGSIFPLFQHLEIGRFYTLDKITQKVNWMNVREICWRVEGTIDYTLGLIQSWMRAV